MSSVLCFLFFFFQAEDGIRDTSVTGVQTCALPIYTSELAKNPSPPADQAVAAPATSGSVEQRLSSLEDTTQLLNSRVEDRKSTRLNSSHRCISYAVFCLKKKKKKRIKHKTHNKHKI